MYIFFIQSFCICLHLINYKPLMKQAKRSFTLRTTRYGGIICCYNSNGKVYSAQIVSKAKKHLKNFKAGSPIEDIKKHFGHSCPWIESKGDVIDASKFI